MSIAFDPKQWCQFSLRSDEAKPESERPIFAAHYLTCRESRALEAAADAAWDITGPDAAERQETALIAALKPHLLDWRNVKDRQGGDVSLSTCELGAALTLLELFELCYRVISATRLGEIDAKKSALPSGLPGAASQTPLSPTVSTPLPVPGANGQGTSAAPSVPIAMAGPIAS